MNVRSHHVAIFMFVAAVVLGTMSVVDRPTVALATCSTGSGVAVQSPAPGMTVTGFITLIALTTAPANQQPSDVSFVITSPSTNVLGDITAAGSTTWQENWSSSTVPDGAYTLEAVAHFGTNTTLDCPSAPVNFTVHNATHQPTLTVGIGPSSWTGKPGQQQGFTATGIYTNAAGQQTQVTPANSTYTWGVTNGGGTLKPQTVQNGPNEMFTAGNTPGTYHVGVLVQPNASLTGGAAIQGSAQATITIVPGPTPSGSPSPSRSPGSSPPPSASPSPTPLTEAQLQALASNPTIFKPPAPSNADPTVPIPVLACMEQDLGSNYQAIAAGQTAPSLTQRLAADACFSGSDKIPSALAPVNPITVSDLPVQNTQVTLGTLKNETIVGSGGTKLTAIVLNGTGTPNSNVFIYFFSDPMVLRAQTDSQGKWTYVLEHPLKPGHHEVYAVSQTDSASFVRTPALPVSIAAAAPGNQDGSLVIENSLTPAQISYAAAAGGLVIVGIFILLRMRRHKPVTPQTNTMTMPTTITPTTEPPAPTDISTIPPPPTPPA